MTNSYLLRTKLLLIVNRILESGEIRRPSSFLERFPNRPRKNENRLNELTIFELPEKFTCNSAGAKLAPTEIVVETMLFCVTGDGILPSMVSNRTMDVLIGIINLYPSCNCGCYIISNLRLHHDRKAQVVFSALLPEDQVQSRYRRLGLKKRSCY